MPVPSVQIQNQNERTHPSAPWRRKLAVFCATFATLVVPLSGGDAGLTLQLPVEEGAAHGFPAMRDQQGRKLADGEFSQTPEGDRLRVRLTYDFGAGHRIEENTLLRQKPALDQEEWSWEETRDGQLVRRFSVNFTTARAIAEKMERDGRRRWEKTLKLERGRTFAGFAFTLAAASLRMRLAQGEKIELRAVGFTPTPRVVTVEISYGGLDEMAMGGRRVTGEHFIIHPKIPWIAKPFITAPDTSIWLIHPAPRGFLRWEGPLGEPGDEIVRVDLLPGGTSRAAEPVSESGFPAAGTGGPKR